MRHVETDEHVGVTRRGARAAVLALLLGLLVALGAVRFGGVAHAADPAGDEYIARYAVDYSVDRSGRIDVTERIEYHFGGRRDAHGIEVRYVDRRPIDGDPGRHRSYPFTLDSVSSPSGAPARAATTRRGEQTVVRIGDPDRSVGARDATYVIRYHVRGVVDGLPDHQSFYVNPIAHGWQVPIKRATVSVKGPAAATAVRCFAGPARSTDESRCTASAGPTSTFSAADLAPGEGVTTVVAFPLGAVSSTEKIIEDGRADGTTDLADLLPSGARPVAAVAGYGLGALAPVLTAVGLTLAYRRRGRDEQYAGLTPGVQPADGRDHPTVVGRRGPVAVRFEPPDGGTPALVGTIIDETADTVDVSATVIDLAVRGWLQLEELPTGRRQARDWRLRRLDPPAGDELLRYENTVYEALFADGDEVDLSDLKNHFASTLALSKKQLYREAVSRGWFRRSPQVTRTRWRSGGVALMLLGVAVAVLASLVASGLDAYSPLHLGGVSSGVALGGGVALAGLMVLAMSGRMPAKTAGGSAFLAQCEGFRQYVCTAEAGQIRVEEAASIFSRYLPYAIVFGVADRWARVFAEVAEAAAAAGYTVDMPTWYLFAGHSGFGSFDGIGSGMGDFTSSAAGTFSSTPGSSGSSGFSSGGGFSGGGGFGGGGGGSW